MTIRFPLLAGLFVALLASVAGLPAAPARRVVLISGEYEYSSALTLGHLADQLRRQPDLDVVFLQRSAPADVIPGLEAINHADLIITFIRRMTLPPEQLGLIQAYLRAGHPLVALRTSCHAFQNWKSFDHEVLGGNYQDHWNATYHAIDRVNPAERENPILAGVPAEFRSPGTLYKLAPLAPGTRLLVSATLAEQSTVDEPVVWTNDYRGGRIFFAALGDPGDFAAEPFLQLLSGGIAWGLRDPALAQRLALRPTAAYPIHPLSAAEFANYRGFPSFLFVDARPAAEFAHDHAKHAVNLDGSAPGADAALAAIKPDKFIAVYGDSEAQAAAMAQRFHDQGFPIVHYLAVPYVAGPAATFQR